MGNGYSIWILTVSLLSFVFDMNAQNPKKTMITGKTLDSIGLPIAYATILVANKVDNDPITGTTTTMDGDFSLEMDSMEKNEFYIEVSYIGFKTLRIDDFIVENNTIKIGNVTLHEDLEQLNEVIITGEKSSTEFRLDKRVFNVGKQLSSAGASALEVLNNVPSVSVNMQGRVSLRGSQGVQMLINGKPSVLTSGDGTALGTITADMIESIEVITNPSAKYDAEGTSGIINIIIKKEEKKGINGSVTLNTGSPNNHSLGVSVNRRTEKMNLFGQLGIGKRTFPNKSRTFNQDYINATTLEVLGDENHNEQFYNLNLGADYHLSKSSVLTLSGQYAFEKENSSSEFEYALDSNASTALWTRDEDTEADNPKWQYEFQYKKEFNEDEKHFLLFSALGSFFGKESESVFNTKNIQGNKEDELQKMGSHYTLGEYTYKIDYTLPISEIIVLEAGSQYLITSVTNDYFVEDFRNDQWSVDTNFTDVFDYDQNVLGLYGTASYEKDKWGLKVGVRMENTHLKTSLENNGEKNKDDYHNFFPSVHTSYNVTDNLSLQLGYSKRIARPDLWDLNPLYSLRDDYNFFTGNPDLSPEYTDSFELTSISKWNNIAFNYGVYYRYTTDVIENVISFEDNITIVKPDNIGKSNTTGLELNAKYSALKWATFNLDFNYNYFVRDGAYNGVSFDFNGNRWQSKALAKFKLPADMDLEFVGNYESKYKTVQQYIKENMYMDIGLRKKILKGKAILNLSVRDAFASKKFNGRSTTSNYVLSTEESSGRFVTFGVSFGFGKGEAMEFSGQKTF